MKNPYPFDRMKFRKTMVTLSKLWVRFLLIVIGLVFGGLLSIVLGFNPPPQTIPLVDFIKNQPFVAGLFSFLLMILTLLSLILQNEAETSKIEEGGLKLVSRNSKVAVAAVTSAFSLALLLFVVTTVIVRPNWCPSLLCSSPKLVLNPESIHDANLEAFINAIQSNYDTLEQDPKGYTISTLPTDEPAIFIGSDEISSFTLAIGVHDLQQSNYPLLIREVNLVVKAVPPINTPFNVWKKGAQQIYNSNPYIGIFKDQTVGASIPVISTIAPNSYTQLKSGESDEIDVHLTSKVPVSVQFQIQITYRIANQTQEGILTLPTIFWVTFSDKTNWNCYEPSNNSILSICK